MSGIWRERRTGTFLSRLNGPTTAYAPGEYGDSSPSMHQLLYLKFAIPSLSPSFGPARSTSNASEYAATWNGYL